MKLHAARVAVIAAALAAPRGAAADARSGDEASPLACAGTAVAGLPGGVAELFVPLQGWLDVEGGVPPYRFASGDTSRLAEGFVPAETWEAAPPPGLALDEEGNVTGAPTGVGTFRWDVAVADDAGARLGCTIELAVGASEPLAIRSGRLGRAVAGAPYEANLAADRAVLRVDWSLAPGSSLPEGLALSEDGAIAGTVPRAALEGGRLRTFAFAVRALDVAGQSAEATVSLEVAAPKRTGSGDDGGGCDATGSAPAWLSLALVALLRGRPAGRAPGGGARK